MRPVSKTWFLLSGETQIRLVHQGRCLQRVLGSLSLHVLPSQASEFVIDEWSELFEGACITMAPLLQELCYLLRLSRRHSTRIRSPDSSIKTLWFAIHVSRWSKNSSDCLIKFTSVSCLSK